MKRLAVILALLCPMQAAALSCVPHSAANVYNKAAEAEEAYVVARGVLTFDASLLPKDNLENQSFGPSMVQIPGRLAGAALSAGGFDIPFDQPVIVEAHCFGPWCASLASGRDALAFLRRDGPDYVAVIDPCGGFVFAPVTETDIDEVLQCHAGGACTPDW